MAPSSPRTGSAYLDEALVAPYGPLAIAHRGGAMVPELRGAENTVRAFRHASDLGYHYLETDVHASRDGVLFAFHDAELARVAGRPGRIREMTAAELATVTAGGEPIPTMAELLEEFPSRRFSIDIKALGAVEPLADLIARTGSGDRVCVSSFDTARIRRFRQVTGGSVTTGAARGEIAAFLAFGRWARGHAGYSVLHLPDALAHPVLVRRAHASGSHVHVWTIDEATRMEQLIDIGIDGIVTDRTDVLKDVLSQRGLWRE